MFGLTTKHDLNVLVLRDAETVAGAVRAALAGAAESERPGLERALAVIEETAATSDAELRARWVRARLDEAGCTEPADSVSAVKVLRAAEPGLSLTAAVRLSRDAAAAEG
ncbi:hypothetical protein ACL02U_10775 [Streptomyces sp. MS06]|uniref:hypothetical protein n=1 Tax=Streptomyces sp. MS06 TaxID=3385974 RepID=UPI0039A19EF2